MKTPLPLQRIAIDTAIKRNTLIADECGSGKTLMAIESARRTGSPVLVVCNNTAKGQWEQFIHEQIPEAEVHILGPAGALPVGFKWLMLSNGLHPNVWIILHYEAVQYIWTDLVNQPWKTIILDEAHRIKNRKAKQTKYLKMCGRMDGCRKIGLTGTPMENHPGDLWSILNWLYPKEFRSYWNFAEMYIEYKQNWQGFRYPIGARNVEHLTRLISPFYLNRRMKDIRDDLPDLLPPETVWLDPGPKQKSLLTQMLNVRDIESEIDGQVFIIQNALVKLVRTQQISSHPSLLGLDGDSAKLDWLKDYIYDNPTEPMLVFTKFRETAQIIARETGADYIIGGEDFTLTALDWFEGNKNVLVATIAAGGASLNLQRANTVIFYDLEWSSILMDQAIHRVYRIDIREHKNVIRLMTNDSADHFVLEALEHKWSNIELINEFIRKFGAVAEEERRVL